MTRVCFVTLGSRGDVQPIILLAQYLLANNDDCCWEPVIVTTNNYEKWIRDSGIEFTPISTKSIDIDAELARDDIRESLVSGDLSKFIKVIQETDDEYEAGLIAIEEACRDADVIVSHALPLVKVGMVGEKLGKPVGSWCSFPLHANGKFTHPMVGWPDFPLLNQFSYGLFDFIIWQSDKKALKKYRKQFGQSKLRSHREYRRWLNSFPAFNAFSPTIVPHCSEWPDNVTSGGFFVAKQHENTELSPELLKFISKDIDQTPVIYLGFGSMPVAASPKFQQFLLDLYQEMQAQQKSYRIVLFTGKCSPNSEATKVSLPKELIGTTFLPVSSAPHHLLFPKCDFVVHHGGAGTTAAALHSGTPSASIPVCCDQIFWTKRSREVLSIPTKPTWMTYQTMTPKKLIDLIEIGLTRQEEARAIAEQLKTNEDGFAAASAWLKQLKI